MQITIIQGEPPTTAMTAGVDWPGEEPTPAQLATGLKLQTVALRNPTGRVWVAKKGAIWQVRYEVQEER